MNKVKCDPSEFTTPASDPNGRSVRIFVRVPPLLNQAISDVLKSGKFPFETASDVVRWSLNRGVKELDAKESCTNVIPFLEIAAILGPEEVRWAIRKVGRSRS